MLITLCYSCVVLLLQHTGLQDLLICFEMFIAVIAFYFAFPLTDFVPNSSSSSLHHVGASSHTTAATASGSTTATATGSSGSSGDDTYPLLLHVPIQQQQQQAGAHSMTRSRHNTHM